MRFLPSIIAVLLIVPGWSGTDRLPLIGTSPAVRLTPFVPTGGWPRRIGALEPVGAMTLSSNDPAFGSFSAMAIRAGRIALLSDGGNVVRFAIRGGQAVDVAGIALRRGPGTGWAKESRDSESLTLDPTSGVAFVGYERANQIWRYSADFARATAWGAPRAMRGWRDNGGPESLAKLPDGRFVVLSERRPKRRLRHFLLFSGDPTQASTRVTRLRYRPPVGYDPSDAAALPDGDLLVLNRRWRFPLRFDATLVRIPGDALARGKIKPGAEIAGRVIATLAAPVAPENCEGLAVTVEHGATMLWIVSDNDSGWWRPTYLYKFRLAR